jgi:RNA polymerase sigma factor (sigma-70 family)
VYRGAEAVVTEPSDTADTGASDAPSSADAPGRLYIAGQCGRCDTFNVPGRRDDSCRNCGCRLPVDPAGIVPPATAWDTDRLYRAVAPQLVRYVRSLLRTWNVSDARVDAEGAVNEAFETMIKETRFSDTPIDNPTAWLYVVAHRRAARAVRRERWIDDGESRGSIEDYHSVRWSSLPPRASANDMRGTRLALQAIADLPYSQRAATYLQTVEGWTLEQIAEYLDCAASTAGVHVYRGKVRVRERLKVVWEPASRPLECHPAVRIDPERSLPDTRISSLGRGRALAVVPVLICLIAAAVGLAHWFRLAFWLAGVVAFAGTLIIGGLAAAGYALRTALRSRRARIRAARPTTRRTPD